MKKFIPAITWAIIIAYLSFSCEKEYKNENVPRGTIENICGSYHDTLIGLIKVKHPSLGTFVMLGAVSNDIYYRITITQTNTETRTYVDTAFWVETPKEFVTSFKRF